MKKIITIFICLSIFKANSQSITNATLGTAGGNFSNSGIYLKYNIGETFAGLQLNSGISLGTGFIYIVPYNYVSTAAIVYRFVGNGNFSNVANWLGSFIPPNPLPTGSEIIIEPITGGQCIMDTSFRINTNARIVVKAGCKLVIPGNLKIN